MAKTILTLRQKDLLKYLVKDKIIRDKFYLTGGTALAEFYLQHRISEDLDFFSEEEVDNIWLATISKRLKEQLGAEKFDIQQSFNRNLVFFTFGKTMLKTEFTYYPFARVEKPKIINNLRVDSLIDIAVNKFFTIYQQPSSRHFIDLYLILAKKNISWEEIVKLARIKFDTVIDPLQLGTQLVLAKNISALPKMIISLKDKDWRNFFYQKSLELKKEIAK